MHALSWINQTVEPDFEPRDAVQAVAEQAGFLLLRPAVQMHVGLFFPADPEHPVRAETYLDGVIKLAATAVEQQH